MREIAVIGVRLLGAYLLTGGAVTAITILGSIVLVGSASSEPGSLLGGILVLLVSQVLLAFAGGVLLLRSRWFAKLFLRGLADVQVERPTNQQLIQAGTFLIGLYFVAGGMGPFVIEAWRVWDHITFHGPSSSSLFEQSSGELARRWIQLVSWGARLVVGAALIFMARPFSRLPFIRADPA